MLKASVLVVLLLSALPLAAQTPNPATDIPAGDVQAFIKALPRDAVSDRPIRVVDVGGYKVGVYGVYRPKTSKQDAVLHETKISEVYHMLTGTGTLVTGGTIASPTRQTAGLTGVTVRGDRIEGGVTRRVSPGDIVVIPGRTPHWWSNLEGDISYLIVRPDPEGKQTLK
jgi:mannose-6-phosphate isomerase-like protein (cupin superfamily)